MYIRVWSEQSAFIKEKFKLRVNWWMHKDILSCIRV
jgi:hypothetical protein